MHVGWMCIFEGKRVDCGRLNNNVFLQTFLSSQVKCRTVSACLLLEGAGVLGFNSLPLRKFNHLRAKCRCWACFNSANCAGWSALCRPGAASSLASLRGKPATLCQQPADGGGRGQSGALPAVSVTGTSSIRADLARCQTCTDLYIKDI